MESCLLLQMPLFRDPISWRTFLSVRKAIAFPRTARPLRHFAFGAEDAIGLPTIPDDSPVIFNHLLDTIDYGFVVIRPCWRHSTCYNTSDVSRGSRSRRIYPPIYTAHSCQTSLLCYSDCTGNFILTHTHKRKTISTPSAQLAVVAISRVSSIASLYHSISLVE